MRTFHRHNKAIPISSFFSTPIAYAYKRERLEYTNTHPSLSFVTMMLSTEKDEIEEVDDLNNSTDDRMYARLASLEVDRSILLEAFLVANWGNRRGVKITANAETVKDIDFARVDVPQMMNSCENGVPFDLSMCGSSFYGAGLPLKES